MHLFISPPVLEKREREGNKWISRLTRWEALFKMKHEEVSSRHFTPSASNQLLHRKVSSVLRAWIISSIAHRISFISWLSAIVLHLWEDELLFVYEQSCFPLPGELTSPLHQHEESWITRAGEADSRKRRTIYSPLTVIVFHFLQTTSCGFVDVARVPWSTNIFSNSRIASCIDVLLDRIELGWYARIVEIILAKRKSQLLGLNNPPEFRGGKCVCIE